MWLVNTSTLDLEEHPSSSPPDYGILSHTWEGREAMFEDLQQKPTKEYLETQQWSLKLVNACMLASRDNLQYMWVDTCCIDKKSSAELSEAINSMFRYYLNASKCYVYLSDLDMNHTPSGEDFESAFCSCRWFTRGWTLQELLAPLRVVFYDKYYAQVGSVIELKLLITRATQIASRYLSNFRDASIAQRLSWAARRSTTREEDIVYCIFGLFDVNMSILYGEGEAKAFRRLQHEIILNSADQSILGWTNTDKDLNRLTFLRDRSLATYMSQFIGFLNVFRSIQHADEATIVTKQGLQISTYYWISYPKEYFRSRINLGGINHQPFDEIIVLALNCQRIQNRDSRPRDMCLCLERVQGMADTYIRLGCVEAESPKREISKSLRTVNIIDSELLYQITAGGRPVQIDEIIENPQTATLYGLWKNW